MENIQIDTPMNLEIDCIKLQKMAFIYNAVQSGWEVKMKGGIYVFSKKHEGKKEIYLHSYLDEFIKNKGWLNSKNNGKLRLEGKEYIVKDGDILNFRFNT